MIAVTRRQAFGYSSNTFPAQMLLDQRMKLAGRGVPAALLRPDEARVNAHGDDLVVHLNPQAIKQLAVGAARET
jgi:hypothetical protein